MLGVRGLAVIHDLVDHDLVAEGEAVGRAERVGGRELPTPAAVGRCARGLASRTVAASITRDLSGA